MTVMQLTAILYIYINDFNLVCVANHLCFLVDMNDNNVPWEGMISGEYEQRVSVLTLLFMDITWRFVHVVNCNVDVIK